MRGKPSASDWVYRQIGELQLELENSKRARSHFELEAGNLVHRVEELEQHNFELSTKLSDAHNETVLSLAAHSEKECGGGSQTLAPRR